MNTKTIAKMTGQPVSVVNAVARDLRIMDRYDATCRCWRVQSKYAAGLIGMLRDGE